MAVPGSNSNDQLREAKDLLQQLNTLKRQLGEQPLNLGEQQLLQIARDLPNDIRRARKELEDIEGTASDLYGKLRGVTSEFKYQATTLGKVRGAFRQLEEAAQNLKYDEQGISDLNTSQLKKLQEKVKKNKELIRQEANSLLNNNRLAKDIEKQVEQKKQSGESEDQINQYVLDRLKNTRTLGPEEKALLQLHFEQRDAVSEINSKILERVEQEKNVNKLLGVGGATVGGISSLMGKLGINTGIFGDAVSEAEEAMRETAKNIQAGTQSGGRLTVLMAGLGPLAKGFGKALTDPLTIINAILDGFLAVNKAGVDYQRLTGQNATAMAGMNDSLATSAQVLELMAELTRQTGIAAGAIFSPEDLGRLAEAQNLLGLSAEQAGNLGIRSKLAGKSIENYEKGIVKSTNNYNALNNTAISHGVVMQDVLNTSDDIALSLGNSDEAITKAAASARGLGLSLEKVDDIANSLMDFETSIGYELEAQLLTGKDINLAKAREYALTNNLAGLSEELKNNGASAAEFANMGRVAQEGLAKALGMSRTELAKSIMMQETAKNLTDDERAAAMGVTVEQLKQMDIQQKIETSLAKLAQAFAPILDVVVSLVDALMLVITPVAKLIAMVVGNPIGKYLLLAVVAANFLGVAVSGVGKAFGSMYKLGAQAITGLIGLFKKGGLSSALGGLKSKLTGGFNQGSTGMGASSPWSPGKKPGPDPSSMTGGFSKINTADLIKGAAAMAIAAVGIYAFAKAIQELEKVQKWDRVAIGLGLFAGSMIALGFAMNLAAPALAVSTPILLGFGASILLLGAGIGLAAAGMSMFVDSISKLTMDSVEPILLLGPALFGIAAGLMAVGTAGLLSLPGLGALAVVSKIAPSIVSAGEKSAGAAKGKADEGSMAIVAQKLDVLIELAKKGTSVKLDGKVLATSNTNNQKQVGSNLG